MPVSLSFAEAVHNVSRHPRIQYLKDSLDLTPYIETAAKHLSGIRIPQEYTDAIYGASMRINRAMSDTMDLQALQHLKLRTNEVYQQVSWRGYWPVGRGVVVGGRGHTPSVAFRHLPPNSDGFNYATEGALFISAQLSSDAVSALRKVRVLI